MKTPIACLLVVALGVPLCWAQTGNKATEDKLVQIEKQLWEAWKNNDTKPFQQNLADNAVGVSPRGVMEGSQKLMQDLTSGNCQVSSYSLEDTKVTWIDSNTALLTYKGNQDATCEGHKLPPSVYASSIYVKKGSSWKGMFHQETPSMETAQSRE